MHHIVRGVAVPQNTFLVEPFIQNIKIRFRNFTVFRNYCTTLEELDVGFRNWMPDLETRRFYTQILLHTDPFTQTLVYTDSFTHNTFTHTPFYTQKGFHANTFVLQGRFRCETEGQEPCQI